MSWGAVRTNKQRNRCDPCLLGTVNPTIEPPELTQDWGNRLLEGTNRTLCTPGPRRKEQWPHKRLTQTSLWVSRSLWWKYVLTVWPQTKQKGGNTAPPITENWIRDLLSMAPPSEQDSVSPSDSLSNQEASISFTLILLHQRADRLKTTITGN